MLEVGDVVKIGGCTAAVMSIDDEYATVLYYSGDINTFDINGLTAIGHTETIEELLEELERFE